MQATISTGGMTVILSGTPDEIAECVRKLQAPTAAPMPTTPGIEDIWKQILTPPTPGRTSDPVPGCICPKPGSIEFGQPWLGVCPIHSVTWVYSQDPSVQSGSIKFSDTPTAFSGTPINGASSDHFTLDPNAQISHTSVIPSCWSLWPTPTSTGTFTFSVVSDKN